MKKGKILNYICKIKGFIFGVLILTFLLFLLYFILINIAVENKYFYYFINFLFILSVFLFSILYFKKNTKDT